MIAIEMRFRRAFISHQVFGLEYMFRQTVSYTINILFRAVFQKALKDGKGKLTLQNLITHYEVRSLEKKTGLTFTLNRKSSQSFASC